MITMDTSLTSKHLIRELDKLIGWRCSPMELRMDNGPELISQELADWAQRRNIKLKFIEKGKPYQNGFIERFYRSLREEVLDAYCFPRIREIQAMAHAWMWIYKNQRPHSALGYKPSVVFLNERLKGLEAFPTFIENTTADWKSLVLNVTN
jgi:putative transposase